MSEESIRKPNTRLLALVGVGAIIIGGAVVAHGVINRQKHMQVLRSLAQANAVPVVALAKISGAHRTDALTLPGTIQAYNRAAIFSRVTGFLQSWDADIGTRVKTGQVLAVIDTPELDQQIIQAKADLATAQANSSLADLTARRWKALLSSRSVAQQAVDEKVGDAAAKLALVDAAKANLDRLLSLASYRNITAPFDGVVTARKAEIGDLIDAGNSGQELFEVDDLHRVRIYVQVPQPDAAAIHQGMDATFNVPEYPGETFHAVVTSMAYAMEPGSRSMLVELQTDNAAGKLFANSYGMVTFQINGSANGLIVPATALVQTDEGSELAVVGPGNRVAVRRIDVGHDYGDSVQVLAGISASDRVIDNPPDDLQNGEVVSLAPSSVTLAQNGS